jgi:hypothetical protein
MRPIRCLDCAHLQHALWSQVHFSVRGRVINEVFRSVYARVQVQVLFRTYDQLSVRLKN